MPEGIETDKIDIWFQDEARVGQQGTISRTWAEKGTRPRVIRQQQFDNAYIFGAVCAQTGDTEAIVSPLVNSDAMKIHLDNISKRTPAGRHAVVILDRASWHKNSIAANIDNVSLLPLPAYSPELNPIEQVWNWMRNHHLSNRSFSNYEDIVDSCCIAWNNFTEKVELVKSICSRKWANLST